jgi:NAD-dependent deacetylase
MTISHPRSSADQEDGMETEHSVPHELQERLEELAGDDKGTVVVMTGAGISAESGIPTFRGREGYWTVGSREYHPQEMATFAMFSREQEAVWSWYLYRRGVCRGAEPNAGHEAVVAMERALGDRFLLITQNVDGLHLRAGNTLARTFQIHGNIDFARCAAECGQPIFTLPEDLTKEKGARLTEEELARLRCPSCGGWARPHVLWFDECYDEEHFRFESSLRAAAAASLLLVVGTSGATNLPMQVGQLALHQGATIVDVNPDPNPFSQMALHAERGHFLQGPSGAFLPQIAAALGSTRARGDA